MTVSRILGTTAICMLIVPATAVAQDVFVYPNAGQSAEQQRKDEYACHQWSIDQTGFDPARPHPASPPPPDSSNAPGGVGMGAARGAVGGAVVGAIAGDTGKGLAIGAATGGVVGGMRRRNYQQQQTQAYEQQRRQASAEYEANQVSFARAYAACLEGHDYTVK